MGSLLSHFYGSSVVEKPDPATGLTPSQIDLVRKCWKILQPHCLDVGVQIMITLFKKYPDYQDLFPKFRGMDSKELAKDQIFHAHCLGIMGVFDQAIRYLHNAGLCAAGLHMVGERHARRGRDKRPFDVLEPLISEILKIRLGSVCTEATLEALDIVFAFIFKEIKRGMDEYNSTKEK